jgi:hypothetical protein
MTPEEERRQAEFRDLEWKKANIRELRDNIEKWTKEYEWDLKRVKEAETPFENLTTPEKVERMLGLSRSNSQYYEQDGRGASIKKEVAEAQQKLDAIWKDLQTKYGIQPNDTVALDRAVKERRQAERNQPLQPAPMSPEEYQQKQERLENLKAYRELRRTLTDEMKRAQAALADPRTSRSAEQKALLQERIAENQSRIATLDKVAQERYHASPTVINKLEEELHKAAPSPKPQASANPKASEPSQDTPPPQPSDQPTPPQRGHFRDLFTIGDHVQDMQRGSEQIKAKIHEEQGAQPSIGKTPFRQLFEQGQSSPEPPRQERDRNR